MNQTPKNHKRPTPAPLSSGADQPDFVVPALRVAGDDLKILTEQLQVQEPHIEALASELSQIAGQYIRRMQQAGIRASRAQSSAALNKVRNQAEKLLSAIAGLGDDARFSVQLQLTGRGAEPGYGIKRLERLEVDIPALALAAKEARIVFKRNGPKPDVDLLMTLDELMHIYEGRTGKRATHLPTVDGTYTGGLRSDADIFCKTFFDAIPRMQIVHTPDDGPRVDIATITIPSATKLGGAIDRYLRDRPASPGTDDTAASDEFPAEKGVN